jgi:signal transduction histidine kinase
MTLEAVASDSPGNALRLEPGYRRYDRQGIPLSGGPATPAIAEASRKASETGYPALSMPYEAGGLWYGALLKERLDAQGKPVGYEGIQFPVARILDWWSRNGLPAASSAALLTRDGRIWLQEPFLPTTIGTPAAGKPFTGAVKADSGYLSGFADYDGGGVDAIVGWRSLESFGLVFAVGMDRAQLPAPSGASATLPLTVALLVTGGSFLLVTFMGRLAAPLAPAAPAEPRRERQPPPPRPRQEAEQKPSGALVTIADRMPAILFEQRVGPNFELSYSYVSHGLLGILGVEPARLEANPEIMFDMVHEKDRERVRGAHETSWTSGQDIDLTYRVVTAKGDERWMHSLARASAWTGTGHESVWDGVLLDVTDQKLAEKELRAARSEAEITSKVKAEFLANVSHELRTPLNAIIGFSEVIGNETFGPIGVDKYLEYARDIHESADHLLALVNDILDLSKIEAGRESLVLEDVEVGELVDSCLRLIHGRAADARLQIRRQVEDSLPRLRVDPLKIKQILINLLSNAVKFTRAGGGVTLRARATADGGVAFAVSDTSKPTVRWNRPTACVSKERDLACPWPRP